MEKGRARRALIAQRKELKRRGFRKESQEEQKNRLSRNVKEVLAFRDACEARTRGIIIVSQDW